MIEKRLARKPYDTGTVQAWLSTQCNNLRLQANELGSDWIAGKALVEELGENALDEVLCVQKLHEFRVKLEAKTTLVENERSEFQTKVTNEFGKIK